MTMATRNKVLTIEESADVISRSKRLEVSMRPSNEFVLQPLDVSLTKLLVQVTGQTDIEDISSVKIKVVTRDAGLHRLADYTPGLKALILDGSCVDSLRDLGSSLKLLETLSVVRCSLKSLDGVWGFRSLITLVARDNSIKSPSPCSLVHKLATLDLANNEIDDPTSFAFLQNCKHLRILDVADNFFDNYRDTIMSLLPQIRVLDGEDVKGLEVALWAMEGEESCGSESDLTSEDEDIIFSSKSEDCALLPVKKSNEKCSSLNTNYQRKSPPRKVGEGDVEKNYSRMNEGHEGNIRKNYKNRGEELNLDSSSSSIYLLTHEFDRLSMSDLRATNVGDKQNHENLEMMSSKLSSGRAICGNLTASLRARNSSKNPFTLPSVRVETGAEANNDVKIYSTTVYNSTTETRKVREMS